jgi:hypothetical protein
MSTPSTRWNLVVSSQTDKALRKFLAAAGAGKKGDISRFVEDAVNTYISDAIRKAAIKRNTGMEADHFDRMIKEAKEWAMLRKGKC